MPAIRVKAPDGSIVNFPEGTPVPVIESAMQQHFGTPAAATARPAAPAAPAARPMLPGAGRYTGLDAAVMAPFSGPKMQALQAGIGQGLGDLLALGGNIVGGGVGMINPSAGRSVNNFVRSYRNALAAETQPVMAGHPVSSLAGQATTFAIPGTAIAKGVGGAAKVASGTARAAGATRAATAIERAAAPVVTGLETGGFRTGMLPTQAAIASSRAAAPTIAARLGDVALRAGTGAAVGGVSAAAANPDDVVTGAIFGAFVPTVGAKAAKIVGNGLMNTWDAVRGTAGAARAADLFRQALGVNLEDAIKVLQAAPEGVTARQALQEAGIDADAFMALGESVEKGAGGPVFGRIENAQDAARQNMLAAAAGGGTSTEARAAAEANRFNLNAMAGPQREAALSRAGIGGQVVPPLEAEAAANRALAAQRAEEARRLGPLAERTANDRQILASVSPLEQPEVTQEALNRASVTAGRVEEGLARAAQGSLEAGAAARTAENKIAELAAQGLRPLDVSPVLGRLEALASRPGDRADPIRRNTFKALAEQLNELAVINGGVIDAQDLYQVRKTAVNDTISRFLNNTGVTGQAARARTASLLAEINPMIDEAIEAAGGKGWTDYIKTYASGAREIERQQLAARAAEMYRADPTAYNKLMQGNNPDAVEEVFGPGSFDILKTMTSGEGAPSRLPAMQEVARQVQRDTDIADAAKRGAKPAKQLLARDGSLGAKIVRTLSRLGTPKIAYTGDLINALTENHIAPQIQTALVEGFRSGKSAAELIAQLPSKDRAAAARAISNPRFWSSITAGSAAAAARAPQRGSVNTMAPTSPDNVNAMAR